MSLPPVVAQRDPASMPFRDRPSASVHVLATPAGYVRYLPLLRRWLRDRLPPEREAVTRVAELACRLLTEPPHVRDPARRGLAPLVVLRDLALDELSAEAGAAATQSARVERWVGAGRGRAYERALATLPLREREVVVLRVEFALTDLEIADETGVSEARVGEIAANGLAALVIALAADRVRHGA